jgi:dTDP-4-amino-4,6-dideoxygalactose transaminase
MLAINDPALVKRAEIIWEKGTDRAAFFRGEINKYGWVDLGSSFLPSEVTAAFLWAQLENLDEIQTRRLEIWNAYFNHFSGSNAPNSLASDYRLHLTKGTQGLNFKLVSGEMRANAHLFYLIFESLEDRTACAAYLKANGILSVFHYQSLHQSTLAQTYFPDQSQRNLPHADRYSDCLLRLPLYVELPQDTHNIQYT